MRGTCAYVNTVALTMVKGSQREIGIYRLCDIDILVYKGLYLKQMGFNTLCLKHF